MAGSGILKDTLIDSMVEACAGMICAKDYYWAARLIRAIEHVQNDELAELDELLCSFDPDKEPQE